MMGWKHAEPLIQKADFIFLMKIFKSIKLFTKNKKTELLLHIKKLKSYYAFKFETESAMYISVL